MKGIFYLTFNGVMNNTNGIGTQTKLLIDGFDHFFPQLQKRYGSLNLNIITPKYSCNYPSYSKSDLTWAQSKIQKRGGNIFFCKNSETIEEFWNVSYWKKLSKEAAKIVAREAEKYEEIFVICIDQPFLHTPIFFNKLKNNNNSRIQWLLTPYSSSYIHDKDGISEKRLAWEYVGITYPRRTPNVYMADICDFLTNHFINYYGAARGVFLPYQSSLFLQGKDFKKIHPEHIRQILQQHNIPLNKKILFCFGRAVWIKGFDVLLSAIPYIKTRKENLHLVLIAVSPPGEKSEYDQYSLMTKNLPITSTIIPSFSRELPQALCQWPQTKIVVCPSRGEPFSNIPMETAIWAKDNGPTILASNIEGFLEQIQDGVNGFLFKNDSPLDLANKMDAILSLRDKKLSEIRKNAYNKVLCERDFFINFQETMEKIWGKPDTPLL